jgi:streptogrisin C
MLGVTGGAAGTASANAGTAAERAMLAAAGRDLGLTPDQARVRFARDAAAARTLAALRSRLGDVYAGGWVTAGTDQVFVAVTDSRAAGVVRAAGGQPRLVSRGERALTDAMSRLDAMASAPAGVPAGIHGWFVDVMANRVVIAADRATGAGATAFAAAAGVDAEVVVSADAPRPQYDIRGGDPYYPNDAPGHCSIGFAVVGGFVTAGHCGEEGDFTTGFNRVAQGTFAGSSFPGNDYAWVRTDNDWTPHGVVNNYAGGTVPVAGSTVAPVGAAVCRSGFTTGWRCGTIQALNQTVNYTEGRVRGLTRTTACAASGDSGGSFITGDQAQGILSGGSATCVNGVGNTFFQPVAEILRAYRLTLVT